MPILPSLSNRQIKIGSTLTVTGTDGNDQVSLSQTGSKLSVTVNGTTKSYTGVKAVLVHARGGQDSLEVARGVTAKVALLGGSGDDTIRNHATGNFVLGNSGNDKIENFGKGGVVHGGFGNDHLKNFGESTVSMGSFGADKIENFKKTIVSGGAGNDSLRNYANGSTVLGMTGNDELRTTKPDAKLIGWTGTDTVTKPATGKTTGR